MKRIRPPSRQTLAALEFLAQSPDQWRYGLEIAKATGLKSGSLYPLLKRCDERNLVESQWLEPSEQGRPPRHAYRITPQGQTELKLGRSRAAAQSAPHPLKEKPA
ncbi:MAG: helix-turn-helix transcriptional regulator [Pseudomonadota bacterium]